MKNTEQPIVKRSFDLIFHAILPKDRKFYPLFDQAAANMVETARALEGALKADAVTRIKSYDTIHRLENVGDDITHAIMNEAMVTFLVPFDREDVQKLAMSLDDVVDFIYGTSKRVDLYKINKITPQMIRLAEITTLMTLELQQAIAEMRSLRNIPSVLEHVGNINKLETEADNVMKSTIAALFREEKDAIFLIKMQEIISFMETTTDKCRDVAIVIEGVVLKYS